MSETLPVDQPVKRVTSESDYANGRIGKIVEIDAAAGRYRVLWLFESNGKKIRDGKGVRTWVKYNALQPIRQGAESTDIEVKA